METEHLFGLAFVNTQIKSWKTSYFRKNSRRRAEILLRLNHQAPEEIFWQYFLELWVDGKLIYQDRISKEAYDTKTYDDKLKRNELPGVLFVTLEEFEPSQKTKAV